MGLGGVVVVDVEEGEGVLGEGKCDVFSSARNSSIQRGAKWRGCQSCHSANANILSAPSHLHIYPL